MSTDNCAIPLPPEGGSPPAPFSVEGREYPPAVLDAIEDRREHLARWLARGDARRTEGLPPGTCARRIEAMGVPRQVQYQSV